MNIDDMTIGELKEIKKFLDSPVKETNSVFANSIGKYAFLSANYNYYGKIESVIDGFVKISDAHIVYETGSWENDEWADSQAVTDTMFVNILAIESWHEVLK